MSEENPKLNNKYYKAPFILFANEKAKLVFDDRNQKAGRSQKRVTRGFGVIEVFHIGVDGGIAVHKGENKLNS